jgi:hypothetical protein
VPEVTVMLGDGRRETSTKLFFIEVKAYRSPQSSREPEPILIAAYGVKDLACAAAAPELPLLRHRFPGTRPALAMGVMAQKEGPIDLIIARDYRRHWPVPISSSCFDADKLSLMKTTFHPGQLLCGRADPDAVGTKMKGVKRRLTLGKGESAGSSTSSSRRPRAGTPAADSPERRRHETPSPIRRVRDRSREPPSRSTSAASSTARRQRDRSVSSRRDKEDVSTKEKSRMDKSVKRREKESPARRAPAKKRARVLSSSSSGSDVVTISSSDDLSISSSSEDEAIAEVKIVDEEEEKQLRVLKEQQEVRRKRYRALKVAVREHGPENLLQRARAYSAAQGAAGEGAETAKTKQQETKAETELSGADQAATERGKKVRSTKRSARRKTEEEERVEPAPSAAGGTSATAAGATRREHHKGKPALLRLEGPVRRRRSGLSGRVVRTSLLRRRLEGPARWRRTSPSGLVVKENSLGWRDQRGGGEYARAGEQASQARSVGGWRDQRGGGRLSRVAKQDSRLPLQLQDTEARQSDP